MNAYSAIPITNVVIYPPNNNIASLYKGNLSFDDIDRRQPEGVLFSKTIAIGTNQVTQLYTTSANNNEYTMRIIRDRGVTSEFKNTLGQQHMLLSFYYTGNYGPKHWFCIIDSTDGPFRSVLFMEKEDALWRQCTDLRKYPVRIALFELARQHDLFNTKKALDPKTINTFIDEMKRIDNTIRMNTKENPDYYDPVITIN